MSTEPDNAVHPMSLIVIGETIVNVTYRCAAPAEGGWQPPYASFDEEYLERRGDNLEPSVTLQGVLPIAEYWRQARPTERITVCTAVATDELDYGQIPNAFGCDCYTLGRHYVAPVVLRVLRIPQPRVGNVSRRQRPHLRIDRVGDHPADFDAVLDKAIAQPYSGRRVCLVRAVTPRFFGCDPKQVLETIQGLQQQLQKAKVELILDIRPLPKDLQILDRSTIVSSTIQRLRELTDMKDGEKYKDRHVILGAFWKLSPARGVLCFSSFGRPAGAELPDGVNEPVGALFCLRDDGDPALAQVYSIKVPKPIETDFPDAGAATGGDAFLAAFATEWLCGSTTKRGSEAEKACAKKALAMAGTALQKTMEQRFGTYVQHAALQNAQLQGVEEDGERDPRGSRLDRIKTAIDQKMNTTWERTKVIAPDFSRDTDSADDKELYVDPLRDRLDQLSELLKKWKPHPGRDVIAIFGESRAGKEYPLNQVLLEKYERNGTRLLKDDIVGPINQFEFLANIQEVATALSARKDRLCVLQIDEIVKGDSARPLLNLLAEKKHSVPTTEKPHVINFSNTLVVLLSSIDPDHMLTDVRARLMGSIKIPPLRERWMELPFTLPNSLYRGLRYWGPPKTLRVSFRLLSALLHHDYRDHGDDADGTPGLDQQNFRAFEDILACVFRHARGVEGVTWKATEDSGREKVQSDYEWWQLNNAAIDEVVSLGHDDLPPALREMLPSSDSDEQWFVYKLAPKSDELELPSVPPATTSDITIEPAPAPSAVKTS